MNWMLEKVKRTQVLSCRGSRARWKQQELWDLEDTHKQPNSGDVSTAGPHSK